jgi:hypothetical protein
MLVLVAAALADVPDEGPVPVGQGTVIVDGVLDEPAWASVEPVAHFVRFEPTQGGDAPGRTEVRFLEDARYLYVGVRVSGADYRVRSRITPREDINEDDQVGIYLDTFGRGTSGYIFYFNPRGIQQDIQYLGGDAWNFDWNTVFKSDGHVTADGYEIEVAFPFRSLAFPSGGGPHRWGVMVTRKIPSEGAKYGFPHLEEGYPRLFQQAAPIEVVTPAPGSGLELQPGLTFVDEGARTLPSDPLVWSGFDPWWNAVRPSLDARYGITPSIAMSATINPDFSQVETDETPIALNQRFAFYFDEKRPFFLDGSGYFDDAAETLYTRSIVEPVYGIKLYGQQAGWSVGALQAVDQSPAPTVNEAGTPGFDEADVEGAFAADSVLRVKRQIGKGGDVAVVLSDKEIHKDGKWQGSNRVAGLDAEIPLGGRWTALGVAQGSRTSPDRHGGPVMTGMGTHFQLQRATGVGTGVNLRFTDITPGARQENGFRTLSGFTNAWAHVDHTFDPAGGITPIVPSAEVGWTRERGGDNTLFVAGATNATVAKVHEFELGGAFDHYDQHDVVLDSWESWASYDGEAGAVLSFGLSGYASRELDYALWVPAFNANGGGSVTVRPTPGIRVTSSFEHDVLIPEKTLPELANRWRTRLQWQFSEDVGLRAIGEYTFGTRQDPMLVSSLLVAWLPSPGTSAYVGYAETTDLSAGAALNRTVFAKGTVLLRI